MRVAIITGSAGLIGGEAAKYYLLKGWHVAGIDNDMRASFFGSEASTNWRKNSLESEFDNYVHFSIDIREREKLESVFKRYSSDVELVVHAAAQPAHDWAVNAPIVDFSVNALGTLNVLEATRKYAPEAVFLLTSTNKVYGDHPNHLPLVELETRWELVSNHKWATNGIDESMSIDCCLHSLFGASKLAADIFAQEYGRYFGLNVGVFRCGCISGADHSGVEMHGFLSYLMKCAVWGKKYTIYGYKGKQVRDCLHVRDLLEAFDCFRRNPRSSAIYNIGGGRFSNCSILEAIPLCEELVGRKMEVDYNPHNRIGDHIWWISNASRFRSDYPMWKANFDVEAILEELYLRYKKHE